MRSFLFGLIFVGITLPCIAHAQDAMRLNGNWVVIDGECPTNNGMRPFSEVEAHAWKWEFKEGTLEQKGVPHDQPKDTMRTLKGSFKLTQPGTGTKRFDLTYENSQFKLMTAHGIYHLSQDGRELLIRLPNDPRNNRPENFDVDGKFMMVRMKKQ